MPAERYFVAPLAAMEQSAALSTNATASRVRSARPRASLSMHSPVSVATRDYRGSCARQVIGSSKKSEPRAIGCPPTMGGHHEGSRMPRRTWMRRRWSSAKDSDRKAGSGTGPLARNGRTGTCGTVTATGSCASYGGS